MSCISSNNWDKISVFCYVTINNFYSIVYLIKKIAVQAKLIHIAICMKFLKKDNNYNNQKQ